MEDCEVSAGEEEEEEGGGNAGMVCIVLLVSVCVVLLTNKTVAAHSLPGDVICFSCMCWTVNSKPCTPCLHMGNVDFVLNTLWTHCGVIYISLYITVNCLCKT